MRLIWRIVFRLLEWPVGLAWKVYASVVNATSRVTVQAEPPPGPTIFVNWHRHQAYVIVHHGERRRWMLVSPAPPLIPVARFCRLAGLRIVYGTSRDRGKQAVDELAALLARGESVTLAVDGPAGPRFQPKRGCVDLALRSGAPIVPIGYRCRRGITLPWRWDRSLLPVPFDTIELVHGAPVTVAAGEEAAALETVRRELDALDGR